MSITVALGMTALGVFATAEPAKFAAVRDDIRHGIALRQAAQTQALPQPRQ